MEYVLENYYMIRVNTVKLVRNVYHTKRHATRRIFSSTKHLTSLCSLDKCDSFSPSFLWSSCRILPSAHDDIWLPLCKKRDELSGVSTQIGAHGKFEMCVILIMSILGVGTLFTKHKPLRTFNVSFTKHKPLRTFNVSFTKHKPLRTFNVSFTKHKPLRTFNVSKHKTCVYSRFKIFSK